VELLHFAFGFEEPARGCALASAELNAAQFDYQANTK
jgi:hypothetical protein